MPRQPNISHLNSWGRIQKNLHPDLPLHVSGVKSRFRSLIEVELRQLPIEQMMVLEEVLELKLLASGGNFQPGLWDTEKCYRASFCGARPLTSDLSAFPHSPVDTFFFEP